MSLDEGVNVVGVCGDGPYSHMEFASDHGLDYPLLCDTTQEMASAYGVLNASKDGFDEVPQRALFLVTPEKRVTNAWRADDNWDEWDEEPVRAVRERLNADATA